MAHDWMKKMLDDRDDANRQQREQEEASRNRYREFESNVGELMTNIGMALEAAVAAWNSDPRAGAGDITVTRGGNGWLVRRPRMPGGLVDVRLHTLHQTLVCEYSFEIHVLASPAKTDRRSLSIEYSDGEWRVDGKAVPPFDPVAEGILRPLVEWVLRQR